MTASYHDRRHDKDRPFIVETLHVIREKRIDARSPDRNIYIYSMADVKHSVGFELWIISRWKESIACQSLTFNMRMQSFIMKEWRIIHYEIEQGFSIETFNYVIVSCYSWTMFSILFLYVLLRPYFLFQDKNRFSTNSILLKKNQDSKSLIFTWYLKKLIVIETRRDTKLL